MFTDRRSNLDDFAASRLGLFIHFGLYSLLGRGEWALNKERIDADAYRRLADRFGAEAFDADDICRRAADAGCRYACLTTMHHEGFCLYDSEVNPFCAAKTACGRDLVAEFVAACRKHGLRVHLYHSLNHWLATPDGADALADAGARKAFVDFAHERLVELVTKFDPIECMWYDGWWPFDAAGWRAREMNDKLAAIQPHLIFNGRNGLEGDFATPEGHMSPPQPYRPWEACMTHNRNWGYHAGDAGFKPDSQVLDLLTRAAMGAGNLLINVGPDGSGRLPQASKDMLETLGAWTTMHGEAIYASEPMTMSLQRRREGDRAEWCHHGGFSVRGETLYFHVTRWSGREVTFAGLEVPPLSARMVHDGGEVTLVADRRDDGIFRVTLSDLPDAPPHPLGGVIAIECEGPPSLYLTGGRRNPRCEHPRYDPVASDILM
ncbi:MAG: alpha-L-fucosidase [Planctomycetota bacterium]